jgi:hypothetical protein
VLAREVLMRAVGEFRIAPAPMKSATAKTTTTAAAISAFRGSLFLTPLPAGGFAGSVVPDDLDCSFTATGPAAASGAAAPASFCTLSSSGCAALTGSSAAGAAGVPQWGQNLAVAFTSLPQFPQNFMFYRPSETLNLLHYIGCAIVLQRVLPKSVENGQFFVTVKAAAMGRGKELFEKAHNTHLYISVNSRDKKGYSRNKSLFRLYVFYDGFTLQIPCCGNR